jgi:uncharacterized membrane protein
MPAARRTVVIERPIDEVFAFLADPTNDPTWRTHVKSIAAQGPMQAGAIVRQQVTGPGGRAIPADLRIRTYDAPARYAFDVIAGPVRPSGEFDLVSTGTGTEVTLRLSAELHGLKKVLMSRSVQSAMDSEVAALDTAKRILEGR